MSTAAPTPIRLEQTSGEFAMERDPRTGLMVPVFFEGGIRSDESIFVMVASYRDFQCRDTVESALGRAAKPERLRIAVVEQNRPGDRPCTEPRMDCAQSPGQPLCAHGTQVSTYKMHADEASGPVYARHVGYRMYRGEAYAMQVDAHCVFVRDWDVRLLSQWRATGNDMAVLSTYLTDIEGSIDATGRSLRKTRPIMCNSDFEGQGATRYLRHQSQPEAVPAVDSEPMLQPFWAAGFSFARGHFVRDVPYDCCLPDVFMGEEISMGVRGWTHGYDYYAPQSSVVFHEYAQHSQRRRQVPKFWEARRRRGDATRSLRRLTALIGMAPGVEDYDATEEARYGLGRKRPVEMFYETFLVDVKAKYAQPLCRFVESGVMHAEFHGKAVTPTGVDYGKLRGFHLQAFLDDKVYKPLAGRLVRSLERQDAANLQRALAEADRVKLAKRTDNFAGLVARARSFLGRQPVP